jgi:hypothetical protein
MKTIKLIVTLLPMFLGAAAYAQEMNMEARRFSNHKIPSGDEIRSEYSVATGQQYVAIEVEKAPAILSVQYDVEVAKGHATLLLKHEGKVIWQNALSANAKDESQIELPGSGEYLLLLSSTKLRANTTSNGGQIVLRRENNLQENTFGIQEQHTAGNG